jgi:predicted nucleic acid-binding protein
MKVFIDTSAFYAILDRADAHHETASRLWRSMVEGGARVVTTNYVLVETWALLQHRLGMAAVKVLNDDMMPVVDLAWVDEHIHRVASEVHLLANRRGLSLVDCVSFQAMRRLGIESAPAFDRHFREQGFPLPEAGIQI